MSTKIEYKDVTKQHHRFFVIGGNICENYFLLNFNFFENAVRVPVIVSCEWALVWSQWGQFCRQHAIFYLFRSDDTWRIDDILLV